MACQGQTLQLIRPIFKFQIKWSVVNTAPAQQLCLSIDLPVRSYTLLEILLYILDIFWSMLTGAEFTKLRILHNLQINPIS
jgi:hypothetical protein